MNGLRFFKTPPLAFWLGLALLHLFFIQTSQANPNRQDSLKAVLPNLSGTERARTLSELCFLAGMSDPATALVYGKEALAIGNELKNDTLIALAANDIGIVYFRIGSYEKAIQFYEISGTLRQQLRDSLQYGSVLMKIGIAHLEMGEYTKAQDFLLKSMTIFENQKAQRHLGAALNNLGRLFQQQRLFEQALHYFNKALELNEEVSDRYNIPLAMGNIGQIYAQQENFDQALIWYLKALDILEQTRDLPNLAGICNNIAIVYRSKDDFSNALNFYNRALSISREINDAPGIALYLNNIGNLHRAQGNFVKAIEHYRQGLDVAVENNLRTLQRTSYKNLSNAFGEMGNSQEAYNNLKMFVAVNDSLLTEESLRSLNEMQTRYETEKKEKEIESLNKENEVRQLELVAQKQQTRFQLFAFLLALVVLLSGGVLIYYRNKTKQEAAMQKALAEERNQRFRQVMDAQELERKRIAMDLHDGLGQLLSTARLHVSTLEDAISNEDPEDLKSCQNALSLVDEAVSEVRNISHNLMPGALIKLGLVSALKELIQKVNRSGKIEIRFRVENLPDRLEESLEFTLYRIAQETLNNMIRHSEADLIEIAITKTDNQLELTLTDNGKGMNTEAISQSRGIGWKNIISRVEMVQGKLTINSAPGKGMKLTAMVPV